MKNLIEILKQCPSGMELNCSMYSNLYFDRIEETSIFPIVTYTINNDVKNLILFTETGCYNRHGTAKCVIFPKGKTTWEGFHRPFVEGDIASTGSGMYIGIVKSTKDNNECCTFCSIHGKKDFHIGKELLFSRLATKEEKQIMFDIIKANGYHWNAETKTLEKLPKFKDGDIVTSLNASIYILTDRHGYFFAPCGLIADHKSENHRLKVDTISISVDNMRLASEEEKQKLFDAIKEKGYKWNAKTKTLEKLIEPVFKVGDRIRTKKGASVPLSNILITEVNEYSYNGIIGFTTNPAHINFKYQDKYELMPKKFDISILKPFESKVLVRDGSTFTWKPAIFGYYKNDKHIKYCVVGGVYWNQCIPYDYNRHLLGTTDDCDDFYKT